MLDFIKNIIQSRYVKFNEQEKAIINSDPYQGSENVNEVLEDNIDYKQVLKNYLNGDITEDRLLQIYKHHYGSIFIQAISLAYEKEIPIEDTYTIIKNKKYYKNDIASIFIAKKSIYYLDFFQLIIDLEEDYIINNIVKNIRSLMGLCLKNKIKDKFSDFFFYDKEISKQFYEYLKVTTDEDSFELEEDKEFFNKLMLRGKLNNNLNSVEKKEKVKKI